MARPPDAEKPRDERVVLRVMSDERDAWMAAAKRAGLGLSAWLRELANRAAARSARKRGKP